MALEFCLQQLEPVPEGLANCKDRLTWCNLVQCIRPVVDVLKKLSSGISGQQRKTDRNMAKFTDRVFGEKSAQILQNCT